MYRTREVRKLAVDSGATAMVTHPSLWAAQGADVVTDLPVRTVFLTAMEDFAAQVPDRFERLREAADSLPDVPRVQTVDLTSALRGALEGAGALPGLDVPSADGAAVLAYTSGTTGPPKGAVVTHRNLVEAGWGFAHVNEMLSPAEVQLCIAPLVHITGIGVSMMTWLLSGSTMVLGHRFQPDQVWYQEEATAHTFRAGWLHTGDVAFMDDEGDPGAVHRCAAQERQREDSPPGTARDVAGLASIAVNVALSSPPLARRRRKAANRDESEPVRAARAGAGLTGRAFRMRERTLRT